MNSRLFGGAYDGASVLVTGHTGFKGTWLCEWLLTMGASVTGYSESVADGSSMFGSIGLESRMNHVLGDVRDFERLSDVIEAARPDYVFHLAAQPLVRMSYEHPVDTFATNVMGTVNVMESLRVLDFPVACVLVTSDKCYENRETLSGYREDDHLGGYDPYSASKGAAEVAIHAYRRSYFMSADSRVRIASARAGNVIGGGDWSADRIVPDSIRNLMESGVIKVRNPNATRPWQHVLESLSGYLWLAALLGGRAKMPRVKSPLDVSEGFNFGPWPDANRTVGDLVKEILLTWPGEWDRVNESEPHHEASLLGLSVDRAFHKLGWVPALNFSESVARTTQWYQDTLLGNTGALTKTHADLAFYADAAAGKGIVWALKHRDNGKGIS